MIYSSLVRRFRLQLTPSHPLFASRSTALHIYDSFLLFSSVCLCICLSVCLSVCLSLSLTLSLSLSLSLSHTLSLTLSLSHSLAFSPIHSLPLSLSHIRTYTIYLHPELPPYLRIFTSCLPVSPIPALPFHSLFCPPPG